MKRRSERPGRPSSGASCALAFLLLAWLALPAGAGAGESTGAGESEHTAPAQAAAGREPLSAEHREWLEDVALLLTDAEREAFLELAKDYQRRAFVRRFWRVRDPYPDTARNELQVRWERRLAEVRQTFGTPADKRSELWLLNGPPDGRYEITCSGRVWPVEVWFYGGGDLPRGGLELRGTGPQLGDVVVVFYRRWGAGPWRLWDGSQGMDALFRDQPFGGEPTSRCHWDVLQRALALLSQVDGLEYLLELQELETPPVPESVEWVETFAAYSTDLPPDAGTFEARLSLDFPGFRGQRTVVQGVLTVPRTEAQVSELGEAGTYNFVLNGEVLRDGELFESFRYRFDVPAATVPGDEVPLVFQRYLRPGGPFTLVLRLEDLASGRMLRVDRELTVPRVDRPLAAPPPADPETARLLEAANASLARGEVALSIVRPPGDLLTGLVRFDTLITASDRVARVLFTLDGRPVLTKTAPPYSVELDLGTLPRAVVLRVAALGAGGDELASDEILVNSGGHRFAVRLVEPRSGGTYGASLRTRAAVEVPEGEAVERLELWLGEERVATLYGPPWVQPVVLPEPGRPALVRAVAYLASDGGMAEDVAWINAPGVSDEVEVQFVELYTAVVDRRGRPVPDLAAGDFRVYEDGVEQEVRRFEVVRNLPVRAAVLLDVSASMEERMAASRQAALAFFQATVGPRDRMALLTFNDRPDLAVRFTRDPVAFAGGLAGVRAERGTALWDSLIFALFYFNGVEGQRTLLVLSDGEDEASRYSYDDALEYARRAGVTIYAVGLALTDSGAKRRLARLAEEKGGRGIFLDSAAGLAAAYAEIEEELRSRYLLAYQSSNATPEERFRTVEVEVSGRGLEAKTIRGYYP